MAGKTDNRERLQELIGSDYTLQWIIGHGGMSTVWLADDNQHDREVAVKVLRPEFSDNDEFLGRFRNEAEAAENIDSDNVVRTYDYREVEDPSGQRFCFIVMEYVRGESLADRLARDNSLSESLALDVMEQAAHGLSIIHRMGLVHRDIKPGNLLITQNGQVKITDFGIAKAAAAVPLTRTGMVVGTAQYVSPEQAQGHRVTPASDVYSLGVVGYEMLAGQRPFTGDSSVSVALAHINQNPDPLSTLISAPARDLIGITLRKDPATRYRDGNELAIAVSKVRFGQRPPQPASAALNDVAEEPSPTASTVMLGNTTQPTTTHPAAPRTSGPTTNPDLAPQTAMPRPAVQQQPPTRHAAPSQSAPAAHHAPQDTKGGSGRGFGIGLLVAFLAVALVGGGFWLATYLSNSDGKGKSQPTTTKEREVVTEWVDPSEETPQKTTETVTQPTEPETPEEDADSEYGDGADQTRDPRYPQGTGDGSNSGRSNGNGTNGQPGNGNGTAPGNGTGNGTGTGNGQTPGNGSQGGGTQGGNQGGTQQGGHNTQAPNPITDPTDALEELGIPGLGRHDGGGQ